MKIRILLFFIFVALFSAAYQIGAWTDVDKEEAELFINEFQSMIEGIDAFGIFLHNTTIALPMFIPGFGVAWGLFSAYSTGFAFASIAKTIPTLATIPPLSILFMSPFGLMELVAYSIGTSRSFILIRMIIKKGNLKPAIRGTVIEIGIMIGLLLFGGYLEMYMIELAQQEGFSMF